MSLTITAKALFEHNQNFNDVWHHRYQSLSMMIFIIVIVICHHRHRHFFITTFPGDAEYHCIHVLILYEQVQLVNIVFYQLNVEDDAQNE